MKQWVALPRRTVAPPANGNVSRVSLQQLDQRRTDNLRHRVQSRTAVCFLCPTTLSFPGRCKTVPNRLRATTWLGATPPCQRPRVPPRYRRTRHDACSAALRNLRHTRTCRAAHAGRTHNLWRRAAHLCARSGLLLAHMAAAHQPHFFAESLFVGLPMC